MKRVFLAFLAIGIFVGVFSRRPSQNDATPNGYVTSNTKLTALPKTQPVRYNNFLNLSPIKFTIAIILIWTIFCIVYGCAVAALIAAAPQR